MTDEVPALVRYFGAGVNGLVGKATEALLLLQGAEPMVAAMTGGTAGEMAKEAVVDAGRRLLRRQHERLADAFAAAEDETGRTPQQLFEHALDQDDERRLDLFVDAFSAAARESNEHKVRAYGRMAASGILAEDEAKVDETKRVFATLAALDEVDLKTLLYMARFEDQPWFVHPHSGGHGIRTLIDELPELSDLIDPVISRLQGLGLLVDRLGETSYQDGNVVSPFARLCVRELMRGDDAGR